MSAPPPGCALTTGYSTSGGTGQTTRDAGRAAVKGSALGVDTSAPRLERARRLSAAEGLRNVTYERGDGQSHRFPPAHFDPSISRSGTVIIEVRIHPNREQEARTMLTDVILPQAKALPGFVSGQWLRALDGHTLRSVHIYDTRENAEATASKIVSEGPSPARR